MNDLGVVCRAALSPEGVPLFVPKTLQNEIIRTFCIQVRGAEETEVVSEDELPTVQKPSVKDAENVSDDELPGPKPAELPADTEVCIVLKVT